MCGRQGSPYTMYVGTWVLIVVVSYDQPCSGETQSLNQNWISTPESWPEVFPKFEVAQTSTVYTCTLGSKKLFCYKCWTVLVNVIVLPYSMRDLHVPHTELASVEKKSNGKYMYDYMLISVYMQELTYYNAVHVHLLYKRNGNKAGKDDGNKRHEDYRNSLFFPTAKYFIC